MGRTFKKCNICNKDISLSNYGRHVKSCSIEKNSNLKINKEWMQENGKYKCPYCNKEFCKKGICSHIWRMHENGKEFKVTINTGRISWNKGLTKETDDRVKINSENTQKAINKSIENGTWITHKASKSFYLKLSIKQSLNNSGGKCKWYIVDNQNVQGTWERDFANIMVDLDIMWIKVKNKKDSFSYYKDDKKKHYTPDFYLSEINKYIEIKGFWWNNDKEKMRLVIQNNPELKDKLLVLEKDLFTKTLKVNSKEDLFNILKMGKIENSSIYKI